MSPSTEMPTAGAMDRTVRALVVGADTPNVLAVEAALVRHGLQVERHEDMVAGWLATWDIVFLDLSSSQVMAGELVHTLMPRVEGAPLVAMLDRSRVLDAIDAMRAGAVDGLVLPADESELLACLRRNIEEARWREQPMLEPGPDTYLFGSSENIVTARTTLTRAAQRRVSAVLISGPVGAGKTRAARYYHAHFQQRTEPVRLSCLAHSSYPIDDAVFEAWDRARDGCLCLEDIDKLPAETQEKLADRLDAFEAAPRGQVVHPRLAVTCREEPLPMLPRLMHRLAAAHVQLTPLAQRREDIFPLTDHILSELSRRSGRLGMQLSADARQLVHDASWDGNVRQLQSVLERALLETPATVIGPDHLDLETTVDVPGPFKLPPNGVDLALVERELLVQALERAGGNRTRAGLLLGINRDQVRYRIEKFGLDSTPL